MKFKRIIVLLFFLSVCIIIYDDYQNMIIEDQCKKEEIDRINNYFQGTFEVYRIPSWIERPPMRDDMSELSCNLYVLQTESDKQKNFPSGIPYWPCGSRKKALKIYNKLPEEEKTGYMVISQSIVYIAYTDEERIALLEKAARYFDNQSKDF